MLYATAEMSVRDAIRACGSPGRLPCCSVRRPEQPDPVPKSALIQTVSPSCGVVVSRVSLVPPTLITPGDVEGHPFRTRYLPRRPRPGLTADGGHVLSEPSSELLSGWPQLLETARETAQRPSVQQYRGHLWESARDWASTCRCRRWPLDTCQSILLGTSSTSTVTSVLPEQTAFGRFRGLSPIAGANREHVRLGSDKYIDPHHRRTAVFGRRRR